MLRGLLLATAHLCAETPLHVACHPTIGQGPCRRNVSVTPQLSSTQNRSPDPRRGPEVRLHPITVTTRLGKGLPADSDNTSFADITACAK